jgi:diacylglycerol kinase family enzyme
VGVVAHADKGSSRDLSRLRRILASRWIDPMWREARKSKHMTNEAGDLIEEGADLIFVWGGDGAVQRVMGALVGRPVTLAVIPAGTANLFAKNLGIPSELGSAVEVGLDGARRRLDVGKIDGEVFGVMAGTGLDAAMLQGADGFLKDRFGVLGYVWAGATSLGHLAVETSIEVDGAAWFDGTSSCVLIGNMGELVKGIAPFPDARPDDARLEIGVVTADGALEWGRTLARSVVGDPVDSPFVQRTRGERFRVTLADARPYELDGGVRKPKRRIKCKVKPGAITVAVPEVEP